VITIIVLSALVVTCVLTCVGITVNVAKAEGRRERSNQVWLDRQVFEAELKLNELASNAFSSMMEAARDSGGDNWPQ